MERTQSSPAVPQGGTGPSPEREGRLDLFIASAPLAMAMFDREMRYLAVSRRWLVDYRLAEDVLGRSHYQVFPEIPERWREMHRRGLAGETLREESDRFDRADGTTQWLRWEIIPWRGASGEVAGILIATEDITERMAADERVRHSEERLRESEERLRMAVEIAGLGFFEHDHRTDQLYFSPVLREIGGFRPDEPLSLGQLLENVPPEDRAGLQAAVERAHDPAGDGVFQAEHRIRRRGGEVRWVSSRARTFFEGEGAERRPVRTVGALADVTAQRAATEALREADRRKDEFIAVLGHELRNPLAPVRTAAEILRRMSPREGQPARAVAVIERQVQHMARLIDDLLDVSRIARGRLRLERERCDLAEIVRQTAEDYRPSLEAAGLSLSVATSPGALWVEGDPVRLAQIAGNLLQNAERFTDAGGRVEVRAEPGPAPGLASVHVADTGVGIDAALLAHLFDPFAQAEQGLGRARGGMGLGLALARGLAELHGGTLRAESPGPGEGATFTLQVPLGAQAGAGQGQPLEALAPLVHRRILLVEDNRDVAESLAELLRLEGHEVQVVFDGAAALRAAREHRPEVVISDIGLPGELDGYAVARALRADPALARCHLIALSGYAGEEWSRRSLEAGFLVHLAKPPDVRILELELRRGPRR